MNNIKIYCFNDKAFDKIKSMWFKENRIKRAMLKQFVRVESFDVDGVRGVEIGIITKLIKPQHLVGQINSDLAKEGFTSKDFKVGVSEVGDDE
jgi:hypothetical protein